MIDDLKTLIRNIDYRVREEVGRGWICNVHLVNSQKIVRAQEIFKKNNWITEGGIGEKVQTLNYRYSGSQNREEMKIQKWDSERNAVHFLPLLLLKTCKENSKLHV